MATAQTPEGDRAVLLLVGNMVMRLKEECQYSHPRGTPGCSPCSGHHRNWMQNTGQQATYSRPGAGSAGWSPTPRSEQWALPRRVIILESLPISPPTQARNPCSRLSFPGGKVGRTRAQAPVSKEWQHTLSGGRVYLNAIHLFGV